MTNRTWEDNAQEYADLDQGEGWPFAVLVACSVEKGKDTGGYHDHSDRLVPDTQNDHGKVSARQFAERAGTGKDRVLSYLTAWDLAASAGLVRPAADLTPIDAHQIVLPDIPLKQFYTSSAGRNVPPSRQDKIREQAAKDGTGASKAVDIASNPKALAAAIKADPETAEAARRALQESWEGERRANLIPGPAPKPHDSETERRIRDAERHARERELAEEQDRDNILGSMEILSDLSLYRDRGDQFIARWSRRRIKLATAEREAFMSEVEALQRVVDQIRLLGEGHDSIDDELRKITEEQKR